MSTENNANEQRVSNRRGPDPRFVWGIVILVFLCGILFGSYAKIKNLTKEIDNLTNEQAQSRQDAEKAATEKAELEQKINNLNGEFDKFKTDVQSKITTLKDENIKLESEIDALRKIPGGMMIKYINDEPFVFRWCPPGEFMMGSPKGEYDAFIEKNKNDKRVAIQLYKEVDQHQETIDKGFWILQTEVTQRQWNTIMGKDDNPSRSNVGENYPVDSVSWNDCQEFCKKCTQLGTHVKLPTEAQWEYACRAGMTSAHGGELGLFGWYHDDGSLDHKTHIVGSKKPNNWGIYDMHGNVWEWCDTSSDGLTRYRGGGSRSGSDFCRSASRCFQSPDRRNIGDDLGFRIILVE